MVRQCFVKQVVRNYAFVLRAISLLIVVGACSSENTTDSEVPGLVCEESNEFLYGINEDGEALCRVDQTTTTGDTGVMSFNGLIGDLNLSSTDATIAFTSIASENRIDLSANSLASDTLANLSCIGGQVAQWTGSAWTCATPAASLTEAEVDAFTANNGYALTANLATVATSGQYSDLLGIPAGGGSSAWIDASDVVSGISVGKAIVFGSTFWCAPGIDQATLQAIIDHEFATDNYEKRIFLPPGNIYLTSALELKPFVKMEGIKPKWHLNHGTMFLRDGGWTGDCMIRMAHDGDRFAGEPFYLEGMGMVAQGGAFRPGICGLDIAGVKYGVFRDLVIVGFELAISADGIKFFDGTTLSANTDVASTECHFDTIYIQQSTHVLYCKGFNSADHSFMRIREMSWGEDPDNGWLLKFEGYGADPWPGNEGNVEFFLSDFTAGGANKALVHITSTSGLIKFMGCRYDGSGTPPPLFINDSIATSQWIGGEGFHNMILSGSHADRVIVQGAGGAGSIADDQTGSVMPAADNHFQLGSSTKRWSDVHMVNLHTGDFLLSDLTCAETGIPFQVGDRIELIVTEHNGEEIRVLPVLAR